MNTVPDYEFTFGKGRCLKGRGWRGIVALALVLAILLIAAVISVPLLQSGLRTIRFL